MSLRVFHIIFIVCSLIVSAGFAFWALAQNAQYTAWGIGALAFSAGLVVYGIMYFKKLMVIS